MEGSRLTPWLDGSILALTVMTLLMGGAILLLSRRSLSDVFLASFLILWGITGGSGRLFTLVEVSETVEFRAYVLLRLALFTTMVCFAIVYPNLGMTRWRKRALLAAGGLFVLLASLSLLQPVEATPQVVRDIVRPHMALMYVLSLGLLATRWWRSKPGDYRNQVAWGLLVFVFWCLHDGLGLIGYGLLFGHEWTHDLVLATPWTLAAGVVWLIGVLLALTVIGICIARMIRATAATDDRYIALLAPYLIALTTLQVLQPGFAVTGPGPVHVMMDYLIVVFVVYGVLRFNVVDIELKMKWGLKQGTVAGSFVAVFFIVSELTKWSVEQWLTDLGGVLNPTLLGIIAAGILLFALSPLQRIGGQVADRALPTANHDDAYLVYRKIQIYRTALEGALQDGVVNPSEAGALKALRNELGISKSDHARLETEIRDRIGTLPVVPEVTA